MVAQGTTADYIAPGGTDHLELPPLFVSVAHIIAVEPVTQTVGAGASVVFEVVLTNPSGASAMFNLTAKRPPGRVGHACGCGPRSRPIPTVTIPLTVDVPFDADLAHVPLNQRHHQSGVGGSGKWGVDRGEPA